MADIERRLNANQSAVQDLIAETRGAYNLERLNELLESIRLDLELTTRLIEQHGSDEELE